MDVPSAEAPAFAGMMGASVTGIPCVRFAPRPLTLREGEGNGVLCFSLDSGFRRNDGVEPSKVGIPCERRCACSRPLTLREGDGRPRGSPLRLYETPVSRFANPLLISP